MHQCNRSKGAGLKKLYIISKLAKNCLASIFLIGKFLLLSLPDLQWTGDHRWVPQPSFQELVPESLSWNWNWSPCWPSRPPRQEAVEQEAAWLDLIQGCKEYCSNNTWELPNQQCQINKQNLPFSLSKTWIEIFLSVRACLTWSFCESNAIISC